MALGSRTGLAAAAAGFAFGAVFFGGVCVAPWARAASGSRERARDNKSAAPINLHTVFIIFLEQLD
jgi:hypothetical protein